MPLRLQRSVVLAGYALSFLNLGVLAAAAYFLLLGSRGPVAEVLKRLSGPYPWWLFLRRPPAPNLLLLTGLISIFILVCFSFAANLSISSLYRKTASPELFFAMLFLISLSLEAWRAGALALNAMSMPVSLEATATRVVVFSRIFGLFCLLASSLYAAGMKYTHYSLLTAGILLLSFTLAATLLVDSSTFQLNFLHRMGDRRDYRTILAVLAALIVLSFLAAGAIRRSLRFAAAAAASLLLLGGRELLSYGISPVPAVLGTLFLLAGTVVFVRNIAVYYLLV